MLLLSLSRIVQDVFILNMLLTNIQIECIFSSSAASRARGRSQSMRAIVRTTEFNSNSQFSSPSSSTGSLVNTKPIPVASSSKVLPSSSSATSTADKQIKLIPCERNCFEEVDLKPLVAKETIQMNSISGISLREASEATNSDGYLNPAIHGVRARIRNILRRYSAPAVGSAIGLGGFYVGRNFDQISQLLNNNNTEKYFSAPNLTTTTTPFVLSITKQHTRNSLNDDDEIIDPL